METNNLIQDPENLDRDPNWVCHIEGCGNTATYKCECYLGRLPCMIKNHGCGRPVCYDHTVRNCCYSFGPQMLNPETREP